MSDDPKMNVYEEEQTAIRIHLKDVEVQKLNLQPGDTLAVTIKSDDVDADILNGLREAFRQAMPGVKVLLFGVGLHDELKFSVLSENKENNSCATGQFCADCSCGKKEQFEGENK
jgi:hypothetical protein